MDERLPGPAVGGDHSLFLYVVIPAKAGMMRMGYAALRQNMSILPNLEMRQERLEPPVDLFAVEPFDLDPHQGVQHRIADDDVEKQECGGVGAVDLRLARSRPFGQRGDP